MVVSLARSQTRVTNFVSKAFSSEVETGSREENALKQSAQ
jgi:hypothetical protein